MTSPAQRLAKSKQLQRLKRNDASKSETILWTCKITEERELLNLSMRDVADAVGLSVSAFFRIEKGYADVSLSNAMSIAQFFGKTVYQLWPQWRGK
jgi:DNA-binding XRE family transcriptional regulator